MRVYPMFYTALLPFGRRLEGHGFAATQQREPERARAATHVEEYSVGTGLAELAEEREEVQICRDFINGVYD